MPVTSFQVGDRVRINSTDITRANKLGTIVQLYLPEEDIYDVELDDDGFPRLMLGRELERLESDPQPLTEREVAAHDPASRHSPPDSADASLGSETS